MQKGIVEFRIGLIHVFRNNDGPLYSTNSIFPLLFVVDISKILIALSCLWFIYFITIFPFVVCGLLLKISTFPSFLVIFQPKILVLRNNNYSKKTKQRIDASKEFTAG